MRSCRAISTCGGGEVEALAEGGLLLVVDAEDELVLDVPDDRVGEGAFQGVGVADGVEVAHLVQDHDVADPVVPGQFQPLLEHLQRRERGHVPPALFADHVPGAAGAPVGDDGLDPRGRAHLGELRGKVPAGEQLAGVGDHDRGVLVELDGRFVLEQPGKVALDEPAQHEPRLHGAVGGMEGGIRLARPASRVRRRRRGGWAGRRCGRCTGRGRR